MTEQIYDMIIIGGGVAGASAGMYSARFNLNVLVFAAMPGGLITTTHLVENYPGIKSITGSDMGTVFIEHARETGAKFEYSTVKEIKAMEYQGERTNLHGQRYFQVKDGSGKEYYSWTIVLATGTNHKHLGIHGEKEFANKGVSYCALCDAGFFKQKVVGVVGGGDSAAIEANILAEHAAEVHVIVRKDAMRAEPVNYDRMLSNPKIKIHFEQSVTEIKGDEKKMTHVILKNGDKMELDGLFVAIGFDPQNELAKQLDVELDNRGMIVVNRYGETNQPAVYGAGDITNAEFKQAIIGAAEGVAASYKAYNYLEANKIRH